MNKTLFCLKADARFFLLTYCMFRYSYNNVFQVPWYFCENCQKCWHWLAKFFFNTSNVAVKLYGPVLLTACGSANHILMLQLYCKVLLKTRSDELTLKRSGHSSFWAWPYLICISRRFPFRRKSYGRSVYKCITQLVLQTFAIVKLLPFAPLFDAQKACLKLFCTWNGCNYCF